MFLEFISIEVI